MTRLATERDIEDVGLSGQKAKLAKDIMAACEDCHYQLSFDNVKKMLVLSSKTTKEELEIFPAEVVLATLLKTLRFVAMAQPGAATEVTEASPKAKDVKTLPKAKIAETPKPTSATTPAETVTTKNQQDACPSAEAEKSNRAEGEIPLLREKTYYAQLLLEGGSRSSRVWP